MVTCLSVQSRVVCLGCTCPGDYSSALLAFEGLTAIPGPSPDLLCLLSVTSMLNVTDCTLCTLL